MSEPTRSVKESHVDWLTLTFKEGGKWEAARAAAQHVLERECGDGEDEKDLRFQGYTGWQAGRVGYGTRDDGGLIRLSGVLADEGLRDLLPLASNVSRIDLAVTALLPEGMPNPMIEGFRVGPTVRPPHGTTPDYQLIEHSRQGTTLYVGARTSPRFGRVYDKWKESQLDYYKGCVRYELEAKQRLAMKLAQAVAAAPDRRSTIRVEVGHYFSQRGVSLAWTDESPDLGLSAFRPRTDDLSRLQWLGTQVRQVVDELRARGRADDVIAALGTDVYSAPPTRLPDWWYDTFADKKKPRVNPVDSGPPLA